MEHEPKPQYEIREAMPVDVEGIRRMQAQSWRDTYQNDEIGVSEQWLRKETASWLTSERLDQSREFLGKVFVDQAQFYRVALEAGEVVGLLHLDTKDDGTKHLWGLYTAKETHGTGLAQTLMELADKWVDGKEVDLEVAEYNERAKAFYRKYGFVEQPGIVELFRDKIPCVRMIRKAQV